MHRRPVPNKSMLAGSGVTVALSDSIRMLLLVGGLVSITSRYLSVGSVVKVLATPSVLDPPDMSKVADRLDRVQWEVQAVFVSYTAHPSLAVTLEKVIEKVFRSVPIKLEMFSWTKSLELNPPPL
jgi:hypothetical protein